MRIVNKTRRLWFSVFALVYVTVLFLEAFNFYVMRGARRTEGGLHVSRGFNFCVEGQSLGAVSLENARAFSKILGQLKYEGSCDAFIIPGFALSKEEVEILDKTVNDLCGKEAKNP